METLKELTEELQKALTKNHVYSIELEIVKLLAGRNESRLFTYSKESWDNASDIYSSRR